LVKISDINSQLKQHELTVAANLANAKEAVINPDGTVQKEDVVDLSKIIDLAPYIYNLKPFKVKNHPELHPDTNAYILYWEQQEKYAVEGYWGLDQKSDIYDPELKGGWRWMTPQHYWYSQFCFIQKENEWGDVITSQPDTRDIDWYCFYVYITCMGFSGFELDENVTCNRLVGKYYKSPSKFQLTPKERKLWKRIEKNITKPDGTLKDYVDPIEYLKGTFSKPLGKPLYDNPMTNLVELSARGSGKSYRGSGLISHAYNFFGSKSWDEYMNKRKGPTICVGSALSSKSGELLSKFIFSQEQLVDNFGSWGEGEDFIPGFFHKEFMGSIAAGNEKNPYLHKYKEKVNNTWKDKGTRTKIVHQSYESNPEAFVGQRSVLMVEDELGLNDKLLESSRADETVMIMNNKMGWAYKTGTGGNIEKITQAKTIFTDPIAFGYLPFKDNWENSVKPIGMFVPGYYVDSEFRDEHGNQDIIAAYTQEIHTRQVKAASDSTTSLDGYIVARPLVPSEIFLAPETNIFPVGLIREHRAKLERRDIFKTVASVGHLEYISNTENQVKWVEYQDKFLKPINSYDLKPYNNNIKGRIVVYQHPSDWSPDPKIKTSLYKVSYDPVRDDDGGTSLACVKVFKGITSGWSTSFQDNIVAEYYGRYDSVDDLHEIAIKLAIYYNAKILPEVDIPDFIRYCKRRRKVHLLQPKPWDAISKVVANPQKKYEYGLSVVHKSMKIHAEQLLKQWLTEKVGTDEAGKPILRLHKIYSLRFLDELIHYNRKRNTDGVSAMFLIMFWRYQEELVPIEKRSAKKEKKKIDIFINQLNNRHKINRYNPFLQ
jgi:hypothetical protein